MKCSASTPRRRSSSTASACRRLPSWRSSTRFLGLCWLRAKVDAVCRRKWRGRLPRFAGRLILLAALAPCWRPAQAVTRRRSPASAARARRPAFHRCSRPAVHLPMHRPAPSRAAMPSIRLPIRQTPRPAAARSSQNPTHCRRHGDGRRCRRCRSGGTDAPVTIVQYASLTCPHCRAFHIGDLSGVQARPISTPARCGTSCDEFPIGKQSGHATIALRCAPPDKYFDALRQVHGAAGRPGSARRCAPTRSSRSPSRWG